LRQSKDYLKKCDFSKNLTFSKGVISKRKKDITRNFAKDQLLEEYDIIIRQKKYIPLDKTREKPSNKELLVNILPVIDQVIDSLRNRRKSMYILSNE